MDEVPGLTRAALHRARVSRDARFDGKFFIAVTSTGIFCRPICPSPTSKNSNVRYYASAAAAASAGFRPCRRCRPEVAPGSPAWLGTSAVVRRALRLIESGALNDSTIDELAQKLGVSARHLGRLFIRALGVSPVAVAQTRRLHFAKQLLDETALPVTRVAMASGFKSLRRFNDAFRQMYRLTPSAVRKTFVSHLAPQRAEEISLTLAYRPPYDWEELARFLARNALAGIEQVDTRGYARTVRLASGPATILISPIKELHALRLTVWGAQPNDLLAVSNTARRVCDLAADPARIDEVLRKDLLLAPLVKRRPGLRIPGVWDPFECLMRALIEQHYESGGARYIAAQLVHRFGERVSCTTDGLTHLFPSAERLADADLDGVGLSAAQRTTLQLMARAVVNGTLDLSAPGEALHRSMVAIAGASHWAAQYVALRGLGEPDAFPYGELSLMPLTLKSIPDFTASAIKSRANAWRPWRGYAAIHLWTMRQDNWDTFIKPAIKLA